MPPKRNFKTNPQRGGVEVAALPYPSSPALLLEAPRREPGWFWRIAPSAFIPSIRGWKNYGDETGAIALRHTKSTSRDAAGHHVTLLEYVALQGLLINALA